MIDDFLFCRWRGVSCVQGVKMIDDCSFCRCRGVSCVQGVKMIGERPRLLQNEQSPSILT
jgi:hypothetical protein